MKKKTKVQALKEDWMFTDDRVRMTQTHDIVLKVPLLERIKMVFTGAFHLHAEISLKSELFSIIKIGAKAVRASRRETK